MLQIAQRPSTGLPRARPGSRAGSSTAQAFVQRAPAQKPFAWADDTQESPSQPDAAALLAWPGLAWPALFSQSTAICCPSAHGQTLLLLGSKAACGIRIHLKPIKAHSEGGRGRTGGES